MKTTQQLTELKQRLLEVSDLQNAGALLNWDQSTYMPPGGAPARGRQMALLGRLAQEKLTDPVVGNLLDDLEKAAFPDESDEAALIKTARRDFEQATKVPPQFLADFLHPHGGELPSLGQSTAGKRLHGRGTLPAKNARYEPPNG
jgi:carboxypeptidase Taq